MSKVFSVIMFLLVLAVGVYSQFCAGCFSPVKGNWQEDETLKKVVDDAVKGISQFLTSTVPEQLTGGELALKEVLSFEKQVVAGMNYRLSVKVVSGNKVFKCDNVRVFKPLPVNCHDQAGSLCLQFSSDSLQCLPDQ